MRWPNFFIVGAAKAGTTSLYHYLSAHPDVFMPEYKEPHFFSTNPGRIQSESAYLRLFERSGNATAVGEASTGYLYDPVTPEWIARAVGLETSIIIVLRSPVDTAYSLWGQMVRDGVDTLDFDSAVAQEPARVKALASQAAPAIWPYKLAYVDRVLYSRQVERYLSVFPRERVHVYIFEEFFRPDRLGENFASLCRSLGIAELPPASFARHNEAKVVRWPALRRLRARKTPLARSIGRLLPRAAKVGVYNVLDRINRSEGRMEPLSAETRERLWQVVRGDVSRLEEILGRSIAHLWEPRRAAP